MILKIGEPIRPEGAAEVRLNAKLNGLPTVSREISLAAGKSDTPTAHNSRLHA